MTRKRVIPILLIIVVVASLAGFQYFSKKTYNIPEGTIGNTNGNLLNNGLFCEEGDKIYFSNPNDDGSLYVMNQDLDSFHKLSSDKVAFINAGGRYLFYSRQNYLRDNHSSIFVFYDSGIFRVNKNGKRLKMLTSNPNNYVTLYGNQVYYQNYTKEKQLHFYRTSIDGKNTELLMEEAIIPTAIADKTMYYTGVLYDHSIHTLDLTNLAMDTFYEGNFYGCITTNDYIYYLSLEDNYAIARVDRDGENPEIIVNERCSTFNISPSGKYIYYQVDGGDNNHLGRINVESGESVIIKPGNHNNINVTSNYVFFQEFNNTTTYYLSTGEDTTITTFNAPILKD